MSIIEGLIGPIAKLIDKIIPDPEARDRAKLELLKLEGSQEMEAIRTRMTAIVAEANSADAVKWLREAVATGFQVYPLYERDALLDKIRKAPEFVQFMTELKATVDGYRREFEGR